MIRMARRKTKNKQEWRDENFCDVLRNEKNGEAQKSKRLKEWRDENNLLP